MPSEQLIRHDCALRTYCPGPSHTRGVTLRPMAAEKVMSSPT